MRFVNAFLLTCPTLFAGAVSFEPNQGQIEGAYHFVGRAPGITYAVAADRLAIAGRGRPVLAVSLQGAHGSAHGAAEDRLRAVSHYVRGRDPRLWLWDVPNYGRVRYRNVYPGIDLIYRGRGGQLEFDFSLAAGTDARAIRLGFSETVHVSPEGDLIAGGARFHKPDAWQEQNGQRAPVPARFAQFDARHVGFELGDYDRRLPLVIDPMIEFATFLGGSDNEFDTRMTAGPDGSIYVAGTTYSADFPHARFTGAPFNRPIQMLEADAYIAKLAPDASVVQWALYFGGSAGEAVEALERDNQGGIYLLGHTSSTNLPVTPGAFKSRIHPALSDLFAAKFDANSGKLLYSTYLSVPMGDRRGCHLSVTAGGSALISGMLYQQTIETTLGAFQTAPSGDIRSFIIRLNAAGSAPVYATYFNLGKISAMRADVDGSVVVGGSTTRNPFPAVNPIPGQALPQSFFEAGYVARLNAAGSRLAFASVLTGSGVYGGVLDLGIDGHGNIHVLGYASGRDFDQMNPLDLASPAPGPGFDPNDTRSNSPFLVKLAPEGSRLLQSTYFRVPEYTPVAGQAYDFNQKLVLRADGKPCLVGLGRSGFTQTAGGLLGVEANSSSMSYGSTLACVDDAEKGLAFRTFLPQVFGPYQSVAVAPDDALIFAGIATSLATTPGVVQPRFAGAVYTADWYLNDSPGDAFIMRVSPANPRPEVAAIDPQVVVTDGRSSNLPSAPGFRLKGSGFAYGARVEFNGVPVDGTFRTANAIETAALKDGPLEAGPIRVTVMLPAPGGGISDARNIMVINAAPGYVSLMPASVAAGTEDTKLIVRASALTSKSVLLWNGRVRAAKWVRDASSSVASHLELILPASELAQASVAEIAVTNPPPGGGTSQVARFVVTPRAGAGNAIPALGISGPFLLDGPSPLGPRLAFAGSGFSSTNRAYWDGQPVPAEYKSATAINVQPPADDLKRVGVHELYIAEGAFKSNAVRVLIARQSGPISAVDPVRRRYYTLTTPQDPKESGDLLIFDLDRLEPLGRAPAGPGPSRMCVSGDGRYVYVAWSPALVRRFNADTGAFDREFDVAKASGWTQSQLNVEDLQAVPGSPDSLLITLHDPYSGQTWLALFDDGRPRRTSSRALKVMFTRVLVLVGRARAFLSDPGSPSVCVRYVDFDESGITGGNMACEPEPPEVRRDNGLTYLRDGDRVVPVAFASFAPTQEPSRWRLAAGLDTRRVYVLEFASGEYQLSEFNLDTLEQRVIASIPPGWSDSYYGTAMYLTGRGQILVRTSTYAVLIPLPKP